MKINLIAAIIEVLPSSLVIACVIDFAIEEFLSSLTNPTGYIVKLGAFVIPYGIEKQN